ncbi:winged helix-turn-helix domain-containing protein [Oceanobacillus sp. FSL K6-2867]|uniref:ArsR/SmtB family transcription factor n=1 Tax=Oceanobacillus sp. FSL K6-2867 TaxID=2954748 RepID=UPI0030D83720
MDIISATVKKRETYSVYINYSPLWECALGIAAITNTPLLDSLEKSVSHWKEMRDSFSKRLRDQLDYVEKNNTWKALLQLLHQKDFATLQEFTTYIEALSEKELKFICLPFVGDAYQPLRERAASQEKEAVDELQTDTAANPFFPEYIAFISTIGESQLKKHLVVVMTDWYKQVVEKDVEQLEKILQRDVATKLGMKEKMDSEEFVEWATAGIAYPPEPSVHQVLLIPHVTYRPWNIVADIEDTKVFYYPVANESISPDDRYLPSDSLLLKYKALGDEARLRIIKLLYERNHTLQEITEELKMGKSTIHHHLKILRAAQLVEIKAAKYALKRKAIDSLTKELTVYLHQE